MRNTNNSKNLLSQSANMSSRLPILRSTLAARRQEREAAADMKLTLSQSATSVVPDLGPLGGLHGTKDLKRTLKRDADEVGYYFLGIIIIVIIIIMTQW
jgi:hypothetical protein